MTLITYEELINLLEDELYILLDYSSGETVYESSDLLDRFKNKSDWEFIAVHNQYLMCWAPGEIDEETILTSEHLKYPEYEDANQVFELVERAYRAESFIKNTRQKE